MDEFLAEMRQIERKWQNRWQETKAFIARVDPTKPKWFITVPYPYASGPLHIGHCRTYTFGDIIARYKRQKGYNVLFPMAFHITGTPVLAIATRITQHDPKVWKLYQEYVGIYEENSGEIQKILNSFKDPNNIAHYFASRLMQDFLRMGFSIDSTRQFTTGDPEYQKFIEWQYRILHEKGYITEGEYPVLFCPHDQNAVGEDDINAGDEEKIEVVPYTGVKFPLSNGIYMVAATLRPETIYGATNLWIHPTELYTQAQVDGETWIIASKAIAKLQLQNHAIICEKEITGAEFIDQLVTIPLVNRQIPVYPATFVDPTHGTGIVYSVPAHAPYDYQALVDLQHDETNIHQYSIEKKRLASITPIGLIQVDGFGEFPAVEICQRMQIQSQHETAKLEEATQIIYKQEFYTGIMNSRTGPFQGLTVEQAKTRAAQEFVKDRIATVIYEVSSFGVTCRCGSPITVAIIPHQYFLNYGDPQWKARATQALDRMTIIPEKYRQSFEGTFSWLDKRPCVRKRGIGTEFPYAHEKGWIIESLSDSVIYMAFYTIIDLIRQYHIRSTQLTPEVFDFIFLARGNSQQIARSVKITAPVLEQLKDTFAYWYPNDFRHTAINHISNHLSFAIFHHVAIFPEQYWLKTFSLNNMLIREGKKMGKSKGNVIPMAHIPEQYSVDLTRLHLQWIATSDSIIDWREKEVEVSLKRLKHFWEICLNSIAKNPSLISQDQDLSVIPAIYRSLMRQEMSRAIDYMEQYNIREFIQHAFFNNLRFLEEIDQYDQLIPEGSLSERGQIQEIVRECIENMVVVMAPVIPHICEELYARMGHSSFVSFSQIPTFSLSETDRTHEQQFDYIHHILDDIANICKLVSVNHGTMHIYVHASWKEGFYTELKKTFGDKMIRFQDIMQFASGISRWKSEMKEISQEAKYLEKNPSCLKTPLLGAVLEMQTLLAFTLILQSRFNMVIKVHAADQPDVFDPKKKGLSAHPNRPALYIAES